MSDPISILVVAEHESDVAHATTLADRMVLASLQWAEPESLPFLRRWRGEFEELFLDVHKIHEVAARRGFPRVRGHFDNRPSAHDYQSAIQALRIARADDIEAPAVVWIRDTDGEHVGLESRIQGWQDACSRFDGEFGALVGGFPHESMEAWMIVAWANGPARDAQAIEIVRQELGFDPTLRPQGLSHSEHIPKSAKNVVRRLGIDSRCMESTELEVLQNSDPARNCGLLDFLEQIRERLVPLVRRER